MEKQRKGRNRRKLNGKIVEVCWNRRKGMGGEEHSSGRNEWVEK